MGVAVDSSDNVYIGDGGNNRIQKFDFEGTFITKWGSQGEGNGEFGNGVSRSPTRVAVDSSNNVYVVDTANHRIQKFDSEGNFITKWGSQGDGDGEFRGPSGVAVDSSNNVYVSEQGHGSRIQKFR
jgi:DNA-binding beta-propeller fold protein YncE